MSLWEGVGAEGAALQLALLSLSVRSLSMRPTIRDIKMPFEGCSATMQVTHLCGA